MLRSSELPEFVFVSPSSDDRRVRLGDLTPRVRAVAAHLSARIPAGSCVGLMFPSEPDLVVNWLASLLAGLEPLVMQYPTRKQSREYWADSVRNTVAVANIAAVLADERSVALGLSDFVATIGQGELSALPDGSAEPYALDDFAIIQLSSGTTGYRKAIRFRSEDLRRHAEDYNSSLGLTPQDTIVSWLPLYHDMGYIACFVMPMMLGIPVAMMDPMAWVRNPAMLFEAIGRNAGTVCYMPNFGFEVMAGCDAAAPDGMRLWISCSEPVSAHTARKFLERIGAPEQAFAPCYAMAENIFAVSFRTGLRTLETAGGDVVSCGSPIAGVDLKIVDGEIWVRSPTSLHHYLGGEDIRDAEGYYPTGDLGEIRDGELYVTGRKQDLLIQAGRKYMLSDIDLALNRLHADIRGRAAAVQIYDERLGTQKPLILIESPDFFLRDDQKKVADSVKEVMGLDQIEVAFVPPRFLTKTSSGKINRKKSAADWLLHRQAMTAGGGDAGDPLTELRQAFPKVDRQHPVEEVLDSLSLTVLRIALGGTGIAFDGKLSLGAIEEALAKARGDGQPAGEEAIRIVSLTERPTVGSIDERHLDRLAERLGHRVTFEHVCLPPSAILLSDLVFCDYFQPRLDPEPFRFVNRALAKLRAASVILMDDLAELFFPPNQVYGVLSHNLERDERADLVSVRWQNYTQAHDRLPLTIVSGIDIPLAAASENMARLAAYLGKPVFRIATAKAFEAFTKDWEYRPLPGPGGTLAGIRELDPDALTDALADWMSRNAVRPTPGPVAASIERSDLSHFCSNFADREHLDLVLDRFGSFAIAGQPASVPYIARKLEEKGKPFTIVPSYAPAILGSLDPAPECLLTCGAQGRYEIAVPAIAVMMASAQWRTLNVTDPDLRDKPAWSSVKPTSGTDWLHRFDLERVENGRRFFPAWKQAQDDLRAALSPKVEKDMVLAS
ncbi:AMP-binding protein [Propylenella binzhouense]|uniref:AMP-dependent synthetase/ligase domain-containing protein n=1 Tax=Propylenella binzhouense TaxID=2555902 RepID=A0A964T5T0_9HYPH|nr:AMP-binding protein [Propylenella binzhouense]MYZ48939.1 hypothetical protein [Propylenella binzhouense]